MYNNNNNNDNNNNIHVTMRRGRALGEMMRGLLDKCDGQACRSPTQPTLSRISPHVAATGEVCGRIIIRVLSRG